MLRIRALSTILPPEPEQGERQRRQGQRQGERQGKGRQRIPNARERSEHATVDDAEGRAAAQGQYARRRPVAMGRWPRWQGRTERSASARRTTRLARSELESMATGLITSMVWPASDGKYAYEWTAPIWIPSAATWKSSRKPCDWTSNDEYWQRREEDDDKWAIVLCW